MSFRCTARRGEEIRRAAASTSAAEILLSGGAFRKGLTLFAYNLQPCWQGYRRDTCAGGRKMSQECFTGLGVFGASPSKEIARDAGHLIIEHGNDADLIAARRADGFFRVGDEAAGRRWAEIFLFLAARHLSACERIENPRAVSAARC